MIRGLHTKFAFLFLLCLMTAGSFAPVLAQDSKPAAGDEEDIRVTIDLGDSWRALAWRFNLTEQELLAIAGSINPQRQPVIGTDIALPAQDERNGRLLNPLSGGLLELAVQNGRNPWTIAFQNNLNHPFSPLLYTPIFINGGSLPPRELPAGAQGAAISPPPTTPGSAVALRLHTPSASEALVALEKEPLIVTAHDNHAVALGGTGAFFTPGHTLLSIRVGDNPLWEQPLAIVDRDWTWEQVTFNKAGVLDPETIRQEREKLQPLWDEATPHAFWQGSFISPIADFVEISSQYGARRSVNGGPYSSYHEGTDFSAYKGSEVRAPAAGKVVLAEELDIRGGAVIVDHGLGLHSGYYHLSAIHVFPGQTVNQGALLGEVGTTGRSTGNHLHWDLLIGRTWIDPLAWLEQDIASWLSPELTGIEQESNPIR